MSWLEKLERKLQWLRIPNLMMYVVIGMSAVFVADFVLPANLYGMLSLNMALVAQGQIWRLVTFIFLPPSASILWIVFSLYFYWIIGVGLEAEWGASRFTLFYLVGVLGSILAAVFTGYSENTYLNLSLFLAFAAIYPNFEVRLFMMIPVKMKYLAILDIVLYGYLFIVGGWSARITILFSLANVLLFFGGDFLRRMKRDSRYWKTRYNFKKQMREAKREREK